MGIYDRDYIQRDAPGFHLGGGGEITMTAKLIIVTFGVYAIQLMTNTPRPGYPIGWFNDFFALHANWWTTPWKFFELLTYGFMHSVSDLKHIIFNMLIVWFLGRDLEYKFGRKEYLAFYLVAIIVSGLAWSGVHMLRGHDARWTAVGASGACSAIIVLFAIYWPRRQVLLFFIIPMPIWLVAVFAVGSDLWGAVNQKGSIGYEAHLGGALFAFLYYRFNWRITSFLPSNASMPKARRRPKLRVHDPEPENDTGIDAEVDEILRKIQREGQDSLTSKERKKLEEASREYQNKKR